MGVKISELNEATSVQNSDVLPIVQNGETKKIPVETLGSQKVNKTGDTLTGSLLFENKDGYDAIRKTRTLNGTDYQITVGLGRNASARMEFVKVPDNVLSSVEIRSNGIYNGITGNKFIESKNKIDYPSWHSVVLTRSDNDYFYLMLYGSNILKEGTYSIANNFAVQTIGTTNSVLTIPKSAINEIYRRHWGFELLINRSGISGIASTQYNGIAIVTNTITLQST